LLDFKLLNRAVAVTVAARILNIVYCQLPTINVIARIRRNAATLSASMVNDALDQVDSPGRSATCTILEESTDRAVLA
jgi:hypothetical protein